MPTNPSLPCCFCQKNVVSYHLHRHIVNQHPEELYSYNHSKTYDDRNIKRFNAETFPKKRLDPVRLDLPEGQDFYYCYGCKVGVKKLAFAKKHKQCMVKHNEGMQEVWEQWKHLIDGSAGPQRVRASESETNFDFTGIQRCIWNLVKQDYLNRAGLNVAERHLEAVEETLQENPEMTAEEFNDLEPMGSMGVHLKEIPWALYGKNIPFEKDLSSLIKKFETSENQEIWLKRIK